MFERGRGEAVVGDERAAAVRQTQTVVVPGEERPVDLAAPARPVQAGEHLPDGEVVQRSRGPDPDFDQQLDQERPVIGKILFNLRK